MTTFDRSHVRSLVRTASLWYIRSTALELIYQDVGLGPGHDVADLWPEFIDRIPAAIHEAITREDL